MSKEWNRKSSVGLIETRIIEKYHIRVYENRLAISKRDGDRLTWEEVQEAKCKIWGDKVAVEVYPESAAVVNIKHTRHLWHSNEIQLLIKNTCCHPEFGTSCAVNQAEKRQGVVQNTDI